MKLIWTDPSIEDLRAVRDYIARDSDYYAADLVEQVVLSVERLLPIPQTGEGGSGSSRLKHSRVDASQLPHHL